MGTTKQSKKQAIMGMRTFNGIWANSLSTREPAGSTHFEYLQNLCKFKNSLKSGPLVFPIDLEFPAGVVPQAILGGMASPVTFVDNTFNSITLIVGEYNLFKLSLSPTFQYTLTKLDIAIPAGAGFDANIGTYPLGTIYSKPILFQEDITNKTIILTYLGFIIEVSEKVDSATFVKYETNDQGPQKTIFKAMSGCKSQFGVTLGTLSSGGLASSSFDESTSLLFKATFPDLSVSDAIGIGRYTFDGLITGMSPTQQHFQLSTLSERYFFEQEDLYVGTARFSATLLFTQTKQSNDIFPYFSFSLPSISNLSGLFDGNNITYTNSAEKDPLPSALPDYQDLNRWYHSENPSNPAPLLIRNLIGSLCQNLESMFFNRVNFVPKGSSVPPINKMMSLSYDFTSYGYHVMNQFDIDGQIGSEIPLLCFFQSVLSDLYPLATYGSVPYDDNGVQKVGIYIENPNSNVLPAVGMPKRHILKSMRLNPFDADGKGCKLLKVQIEMKVEGLVGQGFKAFTYAYDLNSQEPIQFEVPTQNMLIPDGHEKKPSIFEITPNCSGRSDVQIELIIDALYVEITALYYTFEEA